MITLHLCLLCFVHGAKRESLCAWMYYRLTGNPTWPQSWLLPLSHKRCVHDASLLNVCSNGLEPIHMQRRRAFIYEQMSSPCFICSSGLLHKYSCQKTEFHYIIKITEMPVHRAEHLPTQVGGRVTKPGRTICMDRIKMSQCWVKLCHCAGLNGVQLTRSPWGLAGHRAKQHKHRNLLTFYFQWNSTIQFNGL